MKIFCMSMLNILFRSVTEIYEFELIQVIIKLLIVLCPVENFSVIEMSPVVGEIPETLTYALRLKGHGID